MMFGLRTEATEAERIVAEAADAGVNFVDTADQYAAGESERITGKAIRGRRDDWVLATKVCNPMGEGVNRRGLGRKWILQACDESLARLGSDYIDVYYLHKEDIGTPLEESVRAVADLIAAGKVRYFALSNFRSWRIAEICNLCDQAGIDRPVALQPSTGCPRSSCCRPAATTAWASCPTARWRAACSRASTIPTRRRPAAPARAPRTSA
jgi:aryl-alcohol dehydrogenase-like predicted oxidoreductase